MTKILTEAGISYDTAKSLSVYKDMLLDYNAKINLTAITDEKEIAIKHFLDSLSPLAYTDFINKAVIDVGTGAGFPGLPIKIAEPTVRLTLLDSLNKRITFLKAVAEALSLKNISFIHSRAEDAARTSLREAFDIALSRAVAALPTLAEYCLPFVKVGGLFIALKGPEPSEEITSAKKAIALLGGEITAIKPVSLPDCSHTLIIISKTSPTPAAYPRTSAKIKKSSL